MMKYAWDYGWVWWIYLNLETELSIRDNLNTCKVVAPMLLEYLVRATTVSPLRDILSTTILPLSVIILEGMVTKWVELRMLLLNLYTYIVQLTWPQGQFIVTKNMPLILTRPVAVALVRQ
jgi:hypothetical protein